MTRARLDRVEPDRTVAAALIEQARRHLDSAKAPGIDSESAYGLCYQAALKGMVATLLAVGLRVGSGAGAHIVILREAGDRAGIDPDLRTRLDRMRRTRHQLFYELDEVSTRELAAAVADAGAVLDAARRAVDGA